MFRDHFSASRIVIAGDETHGTQLFAVDRDDIVVGATRAARRAFGLAKSGAFSANHCVISPAKPRLALTGAERSVVLRALTRARGNMSEAARELGLVGQPFIGG